MFRVLFAVKDPRNLRRTRAQIASIAKSTGIFQNRAVFCKNRLVFMERQMRACGAFHLFKMRDAVPQTPWSIASSKKPSDFIFVKILRGRPP